jgi:hypothetical protein
MSEPITWAAVGMAAVSNAATWLIIWRGKNGSKRPNGENKKMCGDHANRLTIVETNEKNREKSIDTFIRENREDHQKIFQKLETLG